MTSDELFRRMLELGKSSFIGQNAEPFRENKPWSSLCTAVEIAEFERIRSVYEALQKERQRLAFELRAIDIEGKMWWVNACRSHKIYTDDIMEYRDGVIRGGSPSPSSLYGDKP